MDEATINLLKEEVQRLAALLDDPHPGLQSWQKAINVSLQHIFDLKLGIKKPDSTKGL